MSVTLHNELPSGYFVSLGIVTVSTQGGHATLPLPSVSHTNLFVGKTGTSGTPIGTLVIAAGAPPAFHVGTTNPSGVCYDVKVHGVECGSIYISVSLCPGSQPSPHPVGPTPVHILPNAVVPVGPSHHGAVPVHILPNAVVPVGPSPVGPSPTHLDTHSIPILEAQCRNPQNPQAEAACRQLCILNSPCEDYKHYGGAFVCNESSEFGPMAIETCFSNPINPGIPCNPGEWCKPTHLGSTKAGMSHCSRSPTCDPRCGVQPPLSGRVFPVHGGQGANCGTSDGSLCGHMTGYTWQIPTTMMPLDEDLWL